MPGCILRVVGEFFNPDTFLRDSTLQAYKVWHHGDAVAEVGPRASRIWEHSGFCCDVSKVDSDLRRQLCDAESFLRLFQKELTNLTALPTVDECQLDFGFSCRLNDDVAVQREYFPVSFLQLAGQLKVSVALSLYPASHPQPL